MSRSDRAAERRALAAEAARNRALRPARRDDLGLRRALSDRLLPFLVAAMTFLAALTCAGFVASSGMAARWRAGAAAGIVVQIPDPGAPAADGRHTRRAAVLARLATLPWVASATPMSEGALADMLRPWLGDSAANLVVPLPAVVVLRLTATNPLPPDAAATLDTVAPGTLIEDPGLWVTRLTRLATSVQALSFLVLLIVALVAVSVISVATRAGLAARRDAIAIVHLLGATDGFVAGRFARRIGRLCLLGGLAGAVASVPVLAALLGLSAPFEAKGGPAIPLELGALAALPAVTWVIGWGTAQVAVRRWLARLV